MLKITEKLAVTAIFICFLLLGINNNVNGKDPVDYVRPSIGSIGHLLTATTPDVQMPRGMVRLYPRTTPGIRDIYLADKIFAYTMGSMSLDFSVAGFCVMATTGPVSLDPAGNATTFDHDNEVATPYYYSVFQEDHGIETSYTATDHAALYRFAFPKTGSANLLLSILQNAEIKILNGTTIEGFQHTGKNLNSKGKLYFRAELSKPCSISGGWSQKELTPGENVKEGTNIGVYMTWAFPQPEQLELRIGFSFISTEQAGQNLAKEIPDWNFDRVKNRGRAIWNQALGRIKIEGGTESERTIFYTSLYRVYGRKTTNLTEYGRYYSHYDNQVHLTEGHDFYRMGESWGSFRSLFPLGVILEPERQNDIVRSYLRMYQQCGWLGDAGMDQRVMLGRHETGTITDAYFKGFRDYDAEKIYEGMRKNAMEATMIPWQNGPATSIDSVYFEKGFFPALPLGKKEWVPQAAGFERRQAVSVTLEHAYDDWCLEQMAGALHKPEDQERFRKRAQNYRNLFDERIGFMAPKTAEGRWVFEEKPLDPIWSGGQGGRDYYTETNAWTYTFQVQQDVDGLISLFGGNQQFTAKLDALFQEQFGGKALKFTFLNQFPDGTGLIGQYNHGNQPGFHIPYLYDYAGEAWKTQKRVRDIMKIWYNDGPLGICGDEDEGELSSWYVFSAMGFYPVCPGKPVYAIGSPLFRETAITTADGKLFTILAENVSEKNKYIQSASLNGKPLNVPWLQHADLAREGKLLLKMGATPNKTWGAVTK